MNRFAGVDARIRTVFLVASSLILALPAGHTGEVDGAARGQNFINIPVDEISIGALVGPTEPHDEGVVAFGFASGELALLTAEARTIKAAYSLSPTRYNVKHYGELET